MEWNRSRLAVVRCMAPASMTDNRALAGDLFARGWLRVAIDPATLAPPAPLDPAWERVEGMLLGLGIGDALGNTSESMTPRERRASFGEIRDYLPNRWAGGRAVGLPSDDTQLAFWTVEHLLDAGRLEPESLSAAFTTRRIFGIGSTVRAFLRARARGASWLDAAQESAGNGALMRIAPVILPHVGTPSSALWADAALAGAVTHDDFASNAACVAFVAVLWDALAAHPPVRAGFWLERFIDVARQVEGTAPRYVPRAPHCRAAATTMWGFTERVVREAMSARVPAAEACDRWYSGAFLLETIPSVLYLLERHGNDPEDAMIRAVNDTRDNDSVTAIVGAAVGALHGASALPHRWVRGLSGRLGADDDGAVQALIRRAEAVFAARDV